MSAMVKVVLTALGQDRPGLVSALSEVVSDHQGNWLTSEMARLAGSFAGIVLVEVPEIRLEDLKSSVRRLGDEGLLEVSVALADPVVPGSGEVIRMGLHLLGQDRPGIVREITRALAAHGVTILEFSSDIGEAPQAGGRLFRAEAALQVPAIVTEEQVRSSLEGLAAELMVDLTLEGPEISQ